VKPDTLLYRQIHPNFIQNGRPTTQAFRPTLKDENQLSAYDGDKIEARASWEHYTLILKYSSAGVMAVTNAECSAQSLPVIADGKPFPEHCLIDFSSLKRSEIEKAAKVLASCAVARDWQYRDEQRLTAPAEQYDNGQQ
jgi:hypothetical protein